MSWKLSRPVLRGRGDGNAALLPDFRRTPQEIAEFQDTVERLQELKQLNLIRSLFTERRAYADGEYCILAMVQGGLTADGEQLLVEHQDHISLQQAAD